MPTVVTICRGGKLTCCSAIKRLMSSQEHFVELHGVVDGDPNGQAPASSMVQAAGHHLRPGLHSLWLLLCYHETLRIMHVARGGIRYFFSVFCSAKTFVSDQTGWGTRAGIGDPTMATAAADDKSPSNEKLQDAQRYEVSGGNWRPPSQYRPNAYQAPIELQSRVNNYA